MRSGLFDQSALDKPSPDGFIKVCEGSTAVLFPPSVTSKQSKALGSGDDDQAVFYNPAQVVNRDLSICTIELFGRKRVRESNKRGGGAKTGITILEALSATGLRAIRYYKEINNVKYIIANDLDKDAVDCITRNCVYNSVPTQSPSLRSNCDESSFILSSNTDPDRESLFQEGGVLIPNQDDAVDLMCRLAMNPDVHTGQRLASVGEDGAPTPLLQQELMDVVDLDPYGTASPFLEGAMRCIKEGGLLLVTSTDSPVLCGNFPDTCHAKYNSISYKGNHCHEMAVRLLLASMERVANKHKKYIVPLFSCHIDFYVRCFVRVYTQAAEVKLSPNKLGYQLQCSHCPAFWVRPMAKARPPREKRKRQTFNRKGEEKEEETEQVGGKETEETTTPGKENFPCAPNRQTNPKIVANTLPQLLGPSSEKGHCPVCGGAITISGPLYCAPTQHREFLAELLEVIQERDQKQQITATARIQGLVRLAMEELPQCPLFYVLPEVASYVKVRCPPSPEFIAALGRLGYECSQVHCDAAGLKTNCPPDVLFRVMLAWKEKCNREDGVVVEASNVGKDNSKPILLSPLNTADFSYDKQYDYRRQATGVAKYIPNGPGWGPKRRHQGAQQDEE